MGYSISEIDSLEHDVSSGTHNSMVQIDATHYILAYTGDGGDGYIKTFSIDSNGDTITQIDSLEHDTIQGLYNSLIQIDSTHFALAYAGDSSHGYIKIFSIDGSYNITQETSLEHDITSGTYNSLVLIDSTHLALAYSGAGYDGIVKIFSIDGSFNITAGDSIAHESGVGYYNSLVVIDSTHLALAYTENLTSDGWFKIFTLDGSFNISQTSSYEFDLNADYNSLVVIDSTHFAIAHSGVAANGFITTLSIDGSYNITEEDTLEHDTAECFDNSLCKLNANTLVLAYSSTGDDGYIKTFSIDSNGDTITQIGSLEHDTILGLHNSLLKIGNNSVILAYSGASNDGFIKTFEVLSEEETETATFTELTPAVSGNADPVNPSYIDGLSSFLTTWSGVHTAYSFNNTNANTGTDTTHDANSSSYAQISTANFPNYGTDAKCLPDASGDMDIYTLTDVAMMIYIPSGLTADVNYGLFHNGGGTNAQCGWISNVTGDGITLCISHNAGATNQDEDYYILPGGGDRWYCIGFQFEDNLDNMALWVDGENRSEVARTYELLYGSGDPDIGDSDGVHPSQWGAESPIDGTGIIIANMVVDNPNSTNTTPPGNGDTFYTGFYDEHLAPTTTSWYNNNCDWLYRIKVTIQNAKVDSNLTDYPVYVDLSDLSSDFHSHVNQTDARDIRVTTSDKVTEIPREIVSYDSVTDTGELHFKGDISSAVDTEFYIYYGNSSATEPAVNATYGSENVWSIYEAVYHFNDSLLDSTSNSHTLANSGSINTSSGKIEDGRAFDSDSVYAVFDLSDTAKVSISKWLNQTNLTGAQAHYELSPTFNSNNGAFLTYTDGTTYYIGHRTASGYNIAVATMPASGSFKFLTEVRDLSESASLEVIPYIDGQEISYSKSTYNAESTGNFRNDTLYFNSRAANSLYCNGGLDEFRLVKNILTADWISTEYNNQNSPSTFYLDSAEESCSTPTGGSLINIGDDFKEIASVSINIGDSWKPVTSIKLNVGDSWKDVNI